MEVARRAITDRAALVKELKQIHIDVRDTASDLGTRIHRAAEQRLLGAPFAVDREVGPYLNQLEAFLGFWGVDIDKHVEAAEITCLHRRLGYAGTADLMIWLPTGEGRALELWLIDFKTSATRSAKEVYPENTQQLAALRYCETVLLPDDTEQPMPKIQRAEGPQPAGQVPRPRRDARRTGRPQGLPRGSRQRAVAPRRAFLLPGPPRPGPARTGPVAQLPKGGLTMGSRIRTAQKQARELGRLRTGYSIPNQDPKKRPRPVKSKTWVISSHAEHYVTAAADAWGGKVERWQPQGNGALSSV